MDRIVRAREQFRINWMVISPIRHIEVDRTTRKLNAGKRCSARAKFFFAKRKSSVVRVQAHEFDSLIRLRISRRWPGNEHDAFGNDSALAHPARGPFAPIIRFIQQTHRMNAAGDGEILSGSSSK